MNDTRSLFYSRRFALCSRLLVLVCFGTQVLSPLTAFAEVGLPPPAQHQNAGFPSDQALQRRGYDPKTGVWKVDVQNNGKPTITKNGSDFSGSQGKNVTVTGRYGETGTMNTTVNQRVGTGRLQTVANTVIVANAVNNSYTKNYAAEAAKAFKNGNYLQAAHNSIMTLGATLDGILGGAIRDIATGIGNGLKEPQQYEQSQRQAEAEGNYQKAVAQAAAKKAAEAAQKAQQQDQKKKEEQKREEEAKAKGLYAYDLILMKTFQPNIYKSEASTTYKSYKVYSNNSNLNIYSNGFITNDNFRNVISTGLENPSKISLEIGNLSQNNRIYYELKSYPAGSPNIPNAAKNTGQVNPSDFMLTQKEILDILKRMLENDQTNHAELMNQLAKMGVMNQSAEPSTFSPDTALSAPYTPEGSSTPQQTRFKMNQDGTVGVDYVPRPDLKPNSPEAPNKPEKTTPSRQESPDTPNAPNSPNSPNTPNEPNSPNSPNNQQTPNQKENGLCSLFPNIAACADMGNAEEKDLNIPQNDQDIGTLKPLEHFQTDGVCPKPQSFDFGLFGRFEMGYDTICDIARKLRPILILICMISCSWAAWSAVKEL